MPNILGLLVGRKIQKAEMIHDYLQLWFDNGSLLNIFNVFIVMGFEIRNLSEIVGCEVVTVDVGNAEIAIVFVDEKSIRIGMSDSDYQGPEAMEYIGVGGERVVWP